MQRTFSNHEQVCHLNIKITKCMKECKILWGSV